MCYIQIYYDNEHFHSRYVFNINPDTYELANEEYMISQIEGRCHSDGLVSEDFYCHAMLEGSNKRQIILTSKVKVTFVHPSLEFSKQKLYFRTDVLPETEPVVASGEAPLKICEVFKDLFEFFIR